MSCGLLTRRRIERQLRCEQRRMPLLDGLVCPVAALPDPTRWRKPSFEDPAIQGAPRDIEPFADSWLVERLQGAGLHSSFSQGCVNE